MVRSSGAKMLKLELNVLALDRMALTGRDVARRARRGARESKMQGKP
jgi:hypothetical protein